MENTFNDNLRRIRKEKKITQEQLAEFVGVSPQAVSKWEMNSFPDASTPENRGETGGFNRRTVRT